MFQNNKAKFILVSLPANMTSSEKWVKPGPTLDRDWFNKEMRTDDRNIYEGLDPDESETNNLNFLDRGTHHMST